MPRLRQSAPTGYCVQELPLPREDRLAMRDETLDVREGVGQLRWADSKESARALYPNAKELPGSSGRNPITGEQELVPPGLGIRPFLEIEGVRFSAELTFDARGLERVELRGPKSPVLLSRMGAAPEAGTDAAGPLDLAWTLHGRGLYAADEDDGQAMCLVLFREGLPDWVHRRPVAPFAALPEHGLTGRRVHHDGFGAGLVVRDEGLGHSRMLTVDFERTGRKRVLARFVRAQVP